MLYSKDTTQAKNVIDELGGISTVSRICQIAPSSVFKWKKTGIPQAREMYLRVAFPKLKAWKYKQA